jgi:protein gp37
MGCDGCELWQPKQGIKRCYAGVLHEQRGGSHRGFAPSFDQVTNFPRRMQAMAKKSSLVGLKRFEKPWLDGCPRLIFVSDMSDAMSKSVSFEYLEQEVIKVVTSLKGRRHIWLWLTKRPKRMAEFSGWLAELGYAWPPNLWPGTSITDQKTVTRVSDLLQVGDASTGRFLSVEPQSGPVDFGPELRKIDWVIQGGESGPQARRFSLDWARELRDACRAYEVPYFLKQVGKLPYDLTEDFHLHDPHGGDWHEWPSDLCVREVPRFSR